MKVSVLDISVVNTSASSKISMQSWMKIFEYRLHRNAVASADFYRGNMTLYVTYTDPPGGSRPIRLNLGEFVDGKVVPDRDSRENLEEVMASYPERWAEFVKVLPEAYLAATVMET